jgi:hypothetical protein
MKKKQILVEESEFDAVLSKLLSTAPKPIAERKIESGLGRPKKAQPHPKKKSAS